MKRECDNCGYVEKKSHAQNLFDKKVASGAMGGGPIWPAKICPKCDGIMYPIWIEKSPKQQLEKK